MSMRNSTIRLHVVVPCLAVLAAILLPAYGYAGMPTPLPEDLPRRLQLTEWGHARFQAISFFGAGVLTAAGIVCGLWNWLQRDFRWLPRLTYGKAIGVTVLWGLLFIVVLTMISGARELMTPGAWRKSGFTYQLVEPRSRAPSGSIEAVEAKHQIESAQQE